MSDSHVSNDDSIDRKDIQKKMVSGYAWQGATKAIVQTSSWIATIWVARILAPADYGIMAVVGVFTGFALRVSEMGLAEGLITQKSSNRQNEDGIFTLGIVLAAVVYAILYASAPAIASLYDLPEIELVIRVAGLAMFLGVVKAVPYALVMRDLDFRYRSLVEMTANGVQIVVMVWLATIGYSYWSLVWAFMARHLVMMLAYLPRYGHIPWFTMPTAGARQSARFGVKVTLNRLSFFVLQNSPAAIIGKMLGTTIVGYYNMAFQLAVMPIDKIASVFNQVTFPAIARVHKDRVDDARYLFLQTHRYLLLLVQPALIGLALVAPDLIPLLLTEKWNPVVPVLQIFCLLNILRLSSMIFAPVLSGRNRPELVLTVTVVGLALLPAAVFIGTRMGLIGVMIAWVLVQPILFSISLRFLMRELDLGFWEFVASWIPATVASTGMTVAVLVAQALLSEQGAGLSMAVAILVGVLSYAAVLVLVFRQDVQLISNVIRTMVNRRGG